MVPRQHSLLVRVPLAQALLVQALLVLVLVPLVLARALPVQHHRHHKLAQRPKRQSKQAAEI